MDTEWMKRIEGDLSLVKRLLAMHGRVPVVVTQSNLAVVRQLKGTGVKLGETYEFEGDVTLAYLDSMGSNLWLGLAKTQERVTALESAEGAPAAGIPTGTRFIGEVVDG